MSAFTVISGVSLSLQELLRAHLVPALAPNVALKSPVELGNASMEVSLWLYRATRNPDLLNHPPERTAANQILPHSLPLDLHYLITPMDADPVSKHETLGRVAQTLNDHSIIRGADVKPPLIDGDDELRVVLEPLSLEELTRIWTALDMRYRLSVSYQVQLVRISSDHGPHQASPVTRRESTYDQIVSVR